jgi:hypothetical protein
MMNAKKCKILRRVARQFKGVEKEVYKTLKKLEKRQARERKLG